jgi:hypothetical protein
MKINKKAFAWTMFIGLLISGCVAPEFIDKPLILTSIKAVANYGTYFGAKSGKLDDTKAKYIEEGLRVAIQLVKNNSVNDFANVDDILSKIPAEVKPYIQEALDIVDSKYVQLKGNISAENLEYVAAVLNGAFSGIESYRSSIAAEATINSSIEVKIAADYKEAKAVLK